MTLSRKLCKIQTLLVTTDH